MKIWILAALLSGTCFNVYADLLNSNNKLTNLKPEQVVTSDWKFESNFDDVNLSDFDHIGEIVEGSQVSVGVDGNNKVLQCNASPKQQDNKIAKAYVTKNFPDIVEGDVIELSAKYYLNEYLKDGKIYLMDLDCRGCGWEKNPGIRVYMNEDGYLGVNRGKLGKHLGVFKTNFRVPLKQYFYLKMSYKLGDKLNGLTSMWVDGKLIIQERGVNMPIKKIFEETTEIRLTAEKVSYAQFGVTANSSKTKRAIINVDDVAINIFRHEK